MSVTVFIAAFLIIMVCGNTAGYLTLRGVRKRWNWRVFAGPVRYLSWLEGREVPYRWMWFIDVAIPLIALILSYATAVMAGR